MVKKEKGKELYDYQQKDLDSIFERFENCPPDHNLLYQLPTGGGKTVIFSEITRRYILNKEKKVLILTHRIELCNQTSRMLTEFGVPNKIIESKVKNFEDQNDFSCFVAMVETLNNRLKEDKLELHDIGLVIVDEAHYNSFRKLFKFFDKSFILGVTATPLSSNIKLPMNDIYEELIVGSPIKKLVDTKFLSKATTFSYDVRLGSLKVGINGDYTVKSSELLYSNVEMQSKLIFAYEQRSKGKKTLIFNNGIKTSQQVYINFVNAGYEIRHLDSTMSKEKRREILQWFKEKPDAILTSVGILTTGFDEPTIETIILNRATKSLTLYFQMIGRGSRILPNKNKFNVLDLGNNAARFGLWDADIDWQKIFRNPLYYYENIISDDDIERKFKYKMPEELIAKFANSENIKFDIYDEYKIVLRSGVKSSEVIEKSLNQHIEMCVDNSEELMDAFGLARELEHDIEDRIRHYCYCICNTTRNYREWLYEDYIKRLRKGISRKF